MDRTGADGEYSLDPEVIAPATVCTFDQALSSALSIAYSASRRRRGINAGAIHGSYLVADELHLFPQDEALTTLLWLLRSRPKLPFTLMTATLSSPIAATLAELLDADLLDQPLDVSDRERLGLVEQHRAVGWQDEPISSQQILELARATPGRRVLVVVNTVARAQELGRELRRLLSADELLILHSRFFADDRVNIEGKLRSPDWFGKGRADADGARVLIATQVVEAGLDISADYMLTEWAPANSLVQRWGRCARWGGAGQIIVAPPNSEDPDQLPSPYRFEPALQHPLERTRTWLRENASTAITMNREVEREFLDAVHAETDQAWIDGLTARLSHQSTHIAEAIQKGLYSLGGALIRKVDNRTVLMHGHPSDIERPWNYQGISIATGTLRGFFRRHAAGAADDDIVSFSAPDWVLQYPASENGGERSERRTSLITRWLPVRNAEDLTTNPILVLNPAHASYDSVLGLDLDDEGGVSSEYWSKPVERIRDWQHTPYLRERYDEHIDRMLHVVENHPALWPTVGAVALLIDDACSWPAGMLERVTRAAICLHDAGKLTEQWQSAIRAYQQRAAKPVEPWLVHTDETPGVALEGQGPHALSGAAHALIVGAALDREVEAYRNEIASDLLDIPSPSSILFTAIATHHGADPAAGTTALTSAELLPDEARDYLTSLLAAHGLPGGVRKPRVGATLEPHLVIVGDLRWTDAVAEYVALTTVSRLLRLSDGWSQEYEVDGQEGDET